MVPRQDVELLAVIGQGYVGLPMALRAAASGLKVYGVDTNTETVTALNAGVSHIGDVSDAELQTGLAAGYEATTDPAVMAQVDVVLVCVRPHSRRRVDPTSSRSRQLPATSARTSAPAPWPSWSPRPIPAQRRRSSRHSCPRAG